MRLIDADAFIEENEEIIDCEIDHPKYQDTIRELIDQAPTIKTFTLADIEEQYRKGMEKGLEEARPHGEWKFVQRGKFVDMVCSVCGFIREEGIAYNMTVEEVLDTIDKDDFRVHGKSVFPKFCENCGAGMRTTKEGDDV